MKIIGFVGRSGSGKTTLIERLIPLWRNMGLRVSVIKHTHHDIDFDQPGKDSHRHRQAGAVEVLLTANNRWFLQHEVANEIAKEGAKESATAGDRQTGGGGEGPSLDVLIARLSPCDLVVVEGFKRERIPRVEVFRPELGQKALYLSDPSIHAVVTNSSERLPGTLPQWPLGDVEGVALHVMALAGSVCPDGHD